jgi:basic membrane protein A
MKKKMVASLVLSLLLMLTALAAPAALAEATAAPAVTKNADLKPIAKEDLKVAFIYGSAVGEEGYSFAHDQGRKALEAEGIKTTYLENIPENNQFEKSVRDLIEQGYNVIYATSYGYGKYVLELAQEYPAVYFNHATGATNAGNVATYMGRLYQSQYLAGIAAAYRTASSKIGFVVSFPIPEVLTQVNAFTLGVRSVKPDATVEVKWTNSWYDPVAEKSAGLELVNTGCDVICAYLDTMNAQIAAAEKGAYAIGCSSPAPAVLPDAYLTAPIFNWANYYTKDVQKIIDGTWEPTFQFYGLDSGVVDVDTLTKNNADGAADAVAKAKAAIIDGSLNVFAGELKDNEGKVRCEAGASLTDTEILTMDWFVDGVIGSVSA